MFIYIYNFICMYLYICIIYNVYIKNIYIYIYNTYYTLVGNYGPPQNL